MWSLSVCRQALTNISASSSFQVTYVMNGVSVPSLHPCLTSSPCTDRIGGGAVMTAVVGTNVGRKVEARQRWFHRRCWSGSCDALFSVQCGNISCVLESLNRAFSVCRLLFVGGAIGTAAPPPYRCDASPATSQRLLNVVERLADDRTATSVTGFGTSGSRRLFVDATLPLSNDLC